MQSHQPGSKAARGSDGHPSSLAQPNNKQSSLNIKDPGTIQRESALDFSHPLLSNAILMFREVLTK